MKLVLLSSIFLLACGSQLRKPFCANSLSRLPESFQGTYEIVAPANSAAWSGNWILKSIQFTLDNAGGRLSSFPIGAPKSGALCLIQGRYFLESRNPDGTYSVSEVTKFDQGLIFSMLSVDLDMARSQGMKLQYLPNIDAAVQDGDNFMLQLFNMGQFILDNSQLTAEQVLSVSKPISFQFVMKSLPSSAGGFKTGAKVVLSKSGFKIQSP